MSRSERGLPPGAPHQQQDSTRHYETEPLSLPTLLSLCLSFPPTQFFPLLSLSLPSSFTFPFSSLLSSLLTHGIAESLSPDSPSTTSHFSPALSAPQAHVPAPGVPTPAPGDALRKVKPRPSGPLSRNHLLFRSQQKEGFKTPLSGKSHLPCAPWVPALPINSPSSYLGHLVGMDSPLSRGHTGSSPGSGWYTGPPQADGRTGGYQ